MAARRHERTLRAVIWLDLALSVAFVLTCVVAVPVMATVRVPPAAHLALTVTLLVVAVLLGGFGGVAAVMMMRRAVAGDHQLPAGQRLPLPAGMRPPLR